MPSSSPPGDPSLGALHAAIDEAQPERLRKALRHLCGNSKDTARLAEAILLVPRDGSWTKPTSASNSSSKNEAAAAAEGARNTAQGRKRLRPRYATCRNCEEEFDVTQNGSEDCVYHPEETEVDYDAATWVDHDEDCHGTIDSEEMRREFPEAFIYPCCENIHDSSKKTRY